MDSALEDIAAHKIAQDLRETWQGRVLAQARGRMMLVVASVLAHNHDDAMPVLLRVVKPLCWDDGRKSLKVPFLCSAGTINKSGQIVADVIFSENSLPVSKVMFADTRDLEYEFRKLADVLKLSDADRVEMFEAAKRWVVADRRLDPTMDPRDPDAKRLVH